MTQTAVFDAQAGINTLVSQLVAPTFTTNIWRSEWVSTDDYRRLTLILAMNQASATLGVLVEQSASTAPASGSGGDADAHDYTEATTVLRTNPVTGQAYYARGLTVERIGLWARLVVKHGGVAPTVFVAKLVGAGIT